MKRILVSALAIVGFVYACNLWQATQPFAGVRAADLQERGSAQRLESAVRALVGQFPHRHGGNPRELFDAGEWIEAQLAELRVGSQRQPLTVNGQTYFNVLVQLGPAAGKRIVVGAHYDAHPNTPGADDNASGVATLLELARLLASRPPACPVQLAFWTLEEPPYFRTSNMGSAHHASLLRQQGVELQFALSLEMVGYYRDEPGSQRYPPSFPFRVAYPSEGNFLLLLSDTDSARRTRKLKAAFAGGSPLPLRSLNVSRTMAGADFSDHLNFWNAGYTAFLLTDTAFLRNNAYHLDSDRPERLDYRRMAAAVDGVAAAILDSCSVADRDEAP